MNFFIKMRCLAPFAILLLVLFGCAKPEPVYSTFAKPETDFARYKTFNWEAERPETNLMRAQDDIAHRLIVRTTEEELAYDGLTKSAEPDLWVSYRGTVSPQKSFWQTLSMAGAETTAGYNKRASEAEAERANEKLLKQGVLVINIRDEESMIWSGKASVILRDEGANVTEVVRKIFADYPPIAIR